MSRARRLLLAGATLLLPAAGTAQSVPAGWRELPAPAGAGAMAHNLAPSRAGLLLSWLEPLAKGGHALRVARLEGERFRLLGTVAQGGDFFANWADFPAVVEAPDGALLAHWLAKSGGDTYAYAVQLARSTDGGGSWKHLGPLHADGVPAEHGFVSFAPEGGGVRAVWLDGRAMPAGGAMSLRTARVEGEKVTGEEVLDERVCDCCQTGLAIASGGAVVVYRDRSPQEVRDMAVVRRGRAGWTPPVPVHIDGWRIPGCPVNGPAIAAAGSRVAVAWFTAAEQKPRVQLAFSTDGGAHFGAPVVVDGDKPLGRVGLALDGQGAALVSWLAAVDKDAAILARRVSPEGVAGPVVRLAQTTQARAGGFPRILVQGDRLYVAFVEGDKVTRLRAGSLPVAAFGAP